MLHYQKGITYLGVLFLVAFMGLALAITGTSWENAAIRERELSLIEIGAAYRQAIENYYEATPGTVKRYPESLSDLLLDRRYLPVRRYLRRLYSDPMTKDEFWGVIDAPGGGIMGIYSLSSSEPIKKKGFNVPDMAFENSQKYSEWLFVYLPNAPVD